jgi:hypothetical protein
VQDQELMSWQAQQPREVRAARIEILRELEARAAPAVPALYDLLAELPVEHTGPLLAALAATAPWSHDVLIAPVIRSSLRSVQIDGQRVPGEPDLAQVNAVAPAAIALDVGLRVDPCSSTGDLESLLLDACAEVRARAMALLQRRGAAARAALPALAAARESRHPEALLCQWNADGSWMVGSVDQTERLQLLAAEAIAHIAPSESNLAARARAARRAAVVA